MPYIAFRVNAKANHKSPAAWRRMFHLYSYNQEEFMRHYHKSRGVKNYSSLVAADLDPQVFLCSDLPFCATETFCAKPLTLTTDHLTTDHCISGIHWIADF